MGYSRAGFDVVGVDILQQPHYPFEFHQEDALEFLNRWGRWATRNFDAIHASPPCQAYSVATPDRSIHPDLYGAVRDLLEATGLPWVIENVPGAPYRSGITLCGGMFGMEVRRHRNFETSWMLLTEPHTCPEKPWTVTGHPNGKARETPRHRDAATADGPRLMGCEWMTWNECVQAIPPAYTQFIGRALMAQVQVAA